MTSASTTDPPDAGPTPYAISRSRRNQLLQLGREDGYGGMPDPHTDVAPLTTAAREQLRANLAIQVTRLWETYRAEQIESHPKMLEIDLQLPALRQAVEKANRELDAARQSAPDLSNPEPTQGEQDQGRSMAVIRRRRAEEHRQRISTLEDQLDSAASALAKTEQMRTALAAADENRRMVVVLTEHRLIATFEYERTIYDRALLSRHPLHDLVRPMLDSSVPEISPWASAASDELGRRAGAASGGRGGGVTTQMTSSPTSPAARHRLANAVLRILNKIFGRRTRPDSALPDPPNHASGLVPEMSQAPEWLKRRIDALVETNSLDDGHFGIFDPIIDAMGEVWDRDCNAKHRARQAQLEQVERDLTSATSRLQREAQRAEERVTALGNEISMLSAQREESDEPEAANNGQRRWPVVHRDHRATANEPIEETT